MPATLLLRNTVPEDQTPRTARLNKVDAHILLHKTLSFGLEQVLFPLPLPPPPKKRNLRFHLVGH